MEAGSPGEATLHGRGNAVRVVLLAGVVLACSGGGAGATTPAGPSGWWRDRVFYEVFVRSFADSDGNGVGDLAGLTAHLDDLNDGQLASTTALGVDALWLMPIFPSQSYHGYDVVDYRDVDPRYGTLQDLDALLAAAHARGVRVILDMVPNHTGSGHPWFVDARSGAAAAHRDWYVWSAAYPGPWSGFGTDPWHSNAADGTWYYGIFTSGMPDLNWRNPSVEAALLDAMRFWLARGVDGFRLDAVRYLVENGAGAQWDQPETHAALRRIRAALQADYPDALLVGEVWTALEAVATYRGGGDELSLAFSFDLADAVKSSVAAGDASAAVNVIARTEAVLAGDARVYEAPFLSNHDQVRVMRALGGDAPAARVAAATLLALPGTPFVYYGEELGMQGGTSADDRDKRTPMRWTATGPGYGFTTSATPWWSAAEAAGVDVATERADAGSLWNLYRSLVAQRRALPGLRDVEAVRPGLTGAGAGLLALVRGRAGQRVLFVANYALASAGPFQVVVAGTPAVRLAEGLPAAPTAAGGAVVFPGLEARAFAYVSLD
jgi:glycosidase